MASRKLANAWSLQRKYKPCFEIAQEFSAETTQSSSQRIPVSLFWHEQGPGAAQKDISKENTCVLFGNDN